MTKRKCHNKPKPKKKLLLLGASNTWGWVDGASSEPGRFAYKDYLRQDLSVGWNVLPRAFFMGGGIDWRPDAAVLPDHLNFLSAPSLFGESQWWIRNPDGQIRLPRVGELHPWRDFAQRNLPCDVAVLMVAVGDAIRQYWTSPEDYKEAMLTTCLALLEEGARKVILPVDTPVAQSSNWTIAWTWEEIEERLIAYRQGILEIWDMGIDGIVPGPDIKTELTTPGWTYFGEDVLHPNTEGHRKIADLYLDTLRRMREI